MTIRELRPEDLALVRQMKRAQVFGFPFPDVSGPTAETVVVGVDENDRPVAAVYADRLIQLYLFCHPDISPAELALWSEQFHARLHYDGSTPYGYREANPLETDDEKGIL